MVLCRPHGSLMLQLLPSATAEAAPRLAPARAPRRLAADLLAARAVEPHALLRALQVAGRQGTRLDDVLLAQGALVPARLTAAVARHWDVQPVDPLADPPDPRLIDSLGPANCLRDGLLPWRRVGAATVILTARPDDFARHRARLEQRFGKVALALAPAASIEAAILRVRGAQLSRTAETRVAEGESCRLWARTTLPWLALSLVLGLVVWTWLAPFSLVLALVLWAALTLVATTVLKTAAALAAPAATPDRPHPIVVRLPTVSLIVPLFGEAGIAPRLIARLERLDYPRDRLDVVLAVEAADRATRAALARTGLPGWMRVAVVPEGTIRTKPRALNHALDICRGSIIGIYDAEDAPAPDQIARVVQRFHERPDEVACLQGILDFYNPRTNMLSRCFTLEYAAWFRVVLPGLARLGLVVPLGGTTLFFRRQVLETLGGWDAHNVTEDADLGIRLSRHGYRTELIDTVTEEEANCRPLPWIKQRSRWLKGYMMTWAVHMRNPVLLHRQLGARRFWGFQALFLGTLSQVLLAPLLWSFWLVAFGLPHPVASALPGWAVTAVIALFLLTEGVNLAVGWIGLRRSGQRLSPLWLAALPVYFPMGTLAAYKAAWEMVRKPFYWDKTRHGVFDTPAQRVRTPPASIFSRVS
jgi:cellulose synthase/poly-beta-1,6-N-acetylglucosamine synthase-like glycosyltransferase